MSGYLIKHAQTASYQPAISYTGFVLATRDSSIKWLSTTLSAIFTDRIKKFPPLEGSFHRSVDTKMRRANDMCGTAKPCSISLIPTSFQIPFRESHAKARRV
ncbi:hypothetical protein B5807_03046 [Epicoccum nigrum]|uniref:Uncharacterized protein n=1 Tax=Epicoccum nigrum TaxID=105696 RepID=A0A1Y2M9K1_EPING|nr:hypothetical protein B5807_03046 [Epicoccum nigrum]